MGERIERARVKDIEVRGDKIQVRGIWAEERGGEETRGGEGKKGEGRGEEGTREAG